MNLAALLTAGPETSLLLADEPTNGLDSDAAAKAGRWLREHSEQGAAVRIASHDLAWLDELCGDILWLRRGHAIGRGTAALLAAQHWRLRVRRTTADGRGEDVEEVVTAQERSARASFYVAQGAEIFELSALPPTLEQVYGQLHGGAP